MTVPCTPLGKRLVPGAVHVDGTARVQTVEREQEPLLHQLLLDYQKISGVACLLNTSFNAAGEPIVETPHDACTSFARMGLDVLLLENVLALDAQSPLVERVMR